MNREIIPGLHWIQELGPARPGVARTALSRDQRWCRPGRQTHICQNAYVLVGDQTLLFDTLSPAAGDQVIADLEDVLEDRELDYLVVSHPDVPHAGNTFRILRRYPQATLIAPGTTDTHALYHLEDARKVQEGEEIDLGGGFVVRFQEATFLDAAMSLWMTELTSNTLFSVDWMGLPLLDGEELAFMDEVEDVDADRFYEFHARVMFWFQYVDVEKVVAETNLMLQKHHPAMVAPSHGPVIRSDVWRYFQMMNEVVARVRETGRIGVL